MTEPSIHLPFRFGGRTVWKSCEDLEDPFVYIIVETLGRLMKEIGSQRTVDVRVNMSFSEWFGDMVTEFVKGSGFISMQTSEPFGLKTCA